MSSALCTKKNGSALVLEVIYLIFNEGYAATFITAPFGSSPGRPSLVSLGVIKSLVGLFHRLRVNRTLTL